MQLGGQVLNLLSTPLGLAVMAPLPNRPLARASWLLTSAMADAMLASRALHSLPRVLWAIAIGASQIDLIVDTCPGSCCLMKLSLSREPDVGLGAVAAGAIAVFGRPVGG